MGTPRELAKDTAWRGLIGAGVLAAAVGSLVFAVAALVSSDGPHWGAALGVTGYLLAGFASTSVVALIFAVPRIRTETTGDPSLVGRYASNSNLEQISDWLTKILVGAGLVQLTTLPRGLRALGDYLGDGLGIANGSSLSVAATVYGVTTGFVFTYLWARLRLRVLLETSERDAERAARTVDQLVATLSAASDRETVPTSPKEIVRVASRAAAQARSLRAFDAVRARILWADDKPDGNLAERRSLTALNVQIDLARSTAEAVAAIENAQYALVISDMGRTEDGHYVADAGLNLIAAIRGAEHPPPVLIYSGPRSPEECSRIIAAGATDVITRAVDLIDRAMELIALT